MVTKHHPSKMLIFLSSLVIRVTFHTDVVPNDIPLLLSWKAMERANMTLDFENDHVVVFSKPKKIIVTKSGRELCSTNQLIQ